MTNTNEILNRPQPLIEVPPHPQWPTLSTEEKNQLKEQIKHLLKEQNAVFT